MSQPVWFFWTAGFRLSGPHSMLVIRLGRRIRCSRQYTPTWGAEQSQSQLSVFLLLWKQQWWWSYYCIHGLRHVNEPLVLFLIGWWFFDNVWLWGIHDEHHVKGSQFCSPLPARNRQEVIWLLYRKEQYFCWCLGRSAGNMSKDNSCLFNNTQSIKH